MSVEYLPVEILIDIVLRLPIKSIIRWTSVSKSWNSLIKNPKFITTHLNHNNHAHTNLLLIGRERWYRELDGTEVTPQINLHWDNEAFDEYARFYFPFYFLSDHRYFRFNPVGTCNGLVCIDNLYSFFVWNPCIRKYVIIPTANGTPNSTSVGEVGDCDVYDSCIGFGFDSKTNDYKIVRVVTYVDMGESPPKVDVYSLATGKRKAVTALPPTCLIRKPGLQAFVNGALHWPILRTTNDSCHNLVLVFDLGDEVFHELMLPENFLIEDNSFELSLSVCGESLAAFHTMRYHNSIHVWVMKEYGVLDSWTKVLTVDTEGPEIQVPRIFDFFHSEDDVLVGIGFRKSGEVVIETAIYSNDYKREVNLLSIDSESKEIKDLSKQIKNLRKPGEGRTSINPYAESLFLLDKSEGAVSY